MKNLNVILKRHDKQMLQHLKLHLKGRADESNEKIFNETIRELSLWKSQSPMWVSVIDENKMIEEIDRWIKNG